jgi:hypothetical protein
MFRIYLDPNATPGGGGGTGEPGATPPTGGNGTPTGEPGANGGNPPANPPAPQETFTRADVDRMISQAIKTREENLAAEAEKQRLINEGKFEELYKKLETGQKKLEDMGKRGEFYKSKGVSGELAGVLDVVPLDQLESVHGALTTAIKAEVDRQVAARLQTPAPPANNTPPQGQQTLYPSMKK